ncbi:MAG: hypothetical protein HZA78_12110 [Candidatus Schekmanbacteria bacterium]|nr:hypothetical protein [Candidatus Schekmanbacteria bacterium]
MNQYTKRVLVLPVTIGIMVAVSLTWYLIILRPQKKTAVMFLDSLVRRDLKLLQEMVDPKEFETYKYLYCRSGFTKQLLSYSDLRERDANGYFTPTSSRFSIEVEEKDIFFGVRKLTYFIVMEKKDKWRVIQFSSLDDQFDLEELRKMWK